MLLLYLRNNEDGNNLKFISLIIVKNFEKMYLLKKVYITLQVILIILHKQGKQKIFLIERK